MEKYYKGGGLKTFFEKTADITYDDFKSFVKVLEELEKSGMKIVDITMFNTFKDDLELSKYLPKQEETIEDIISREAYKRGGTMKRVRFQDKVDAISERLEGTKVPKRLKKDYGTTYNKEEAEMAAKRIVGSMKKKYEK